jgi:hypothetical protein
MPKITQICRPNKFVWFMTPNHTCDRPSRITRARDRQTKKVEPYLLGMVRTPSVYMLIQTRATEPQANHSLLPDARAVGMRRSIEHQSKRMILSSSNPPWTWHPCGKATKGKPAATVSWGVPASPPTSLSLSLVLWSSLLPLHVPHVHGPSDRPGALAAGSASHPRTGALQIKPARRHPSLAGKGWLGAWGDWGKRWLAKICAAQGTGFASRKY